MCEFKTHYSNRAQCYINSDRSWHHNSERQLDAANDSTRKVVVTLDVNTLETAGQNPEPVIVLDASEEWKLVDMWWIMTNELWN
jgi:hypothetical protein